MFVEKPDWIYTNNCQQCSTACALFQTLPRLASLQSKPKRIVAPIIDNLLGDTFELQKAIQCGGYECVQTFNRFMKTSFTVSPHVESPTELLPTLIILGGFFVIYKNRFNTLGQFDHHLILWGVENIEISIKNWRCGGEVVINPCSRIGKYNSLSNRSQYPEFLVNFSDLACSSFLFYLSVSYLPVQT